VNVLQKCFVISTGFHLAVFGAMFSSTFFHPKKTEANAESASSVLQIVDSLSQSDNGAELKISNLVPDKSKSEISAANNHNPVADPVKVPRVNTRLVSRNEPKSSRHAETHEEAEFTRKVNRIFGKLAPATTIEMTMGGEVAAGPDNYGDIVRFFYAQSWQPPEDGTAHEGVFAKVAITIGRDGDVIDAAILKGSGNAELDESVRRALARVTSIEPFAEGVKDEKRTYTLNFSVHMVGG
jgi:TonB family protein